MAGIFQVTDLQTRKQALLAESVLCRHALKRELQSLQLYPLHLRRKLGWLRNVTTALALAPVASSLIRSRVGHRNGKKPKSRLRRALEAAFLGWRLYRQYGPLAPVVVSRWGTSGRNRPRTRERAES
jgi:hypothetical protein